MKLKILTTLLCLCLVATVGCDQVTKASKKLKKAEPVKEPLVDMLDDVNLAKIILRPEYEKLVVEKDPFKPLITKEPPVEAIEADLMAGKLEGVQFVGVVKIDNEYAALIVMEAKKGVFRIGDIVMGMKILDIQPRELSLQAQNSQKTFTLKRGEK